MAESDPPFDAVAAAKELDELLGEPGVGAGDVGNEEYIASLEGELESLNAVLAKKEVELQRANQRADQAHAEIEAATKRIGNASTKELDRRTRSLLEGFLPVIDDLDRAIAAAGKSIESADVVEGLSLVKRSMLAQLGKFGVAHVASLGEVFDPNRHEAVALVPVSDASKDGRVIDVMREGYVIGEHTLRPASVAVGKRG